jgi:hypothetical protein
VIRYTPEEALARGGYCSRLACITRTADIEALHRMQQSRPMAPPCRIVPSRSSTAAQRDALRDARDAAGIVFVSLKRSYSATV